MMLSKWLESVNEFKGSSENPPRLSADSGFKKQYDLFLETRDRIIYELLSAPFIGQSDDVKVIINYYFECLKTPYDILLNDCTAHPVQTPEDDFLAMIIRQNTIFEKYKYDGKTIRELYRKQCNEDENLLSENKIDELKEGRVKERNLQNLMDEHESWKKTVVALASMYIRDGIPNVLTKSTYETAYHMILEYILMTEDISGYIESEDTDVKNLLVNLYKAYIETDDTVYDTPKKIKEKLDLTIYSQDEAKREAALMAFEMLNNRRRNAIFVGPSGCGKTEIFRELKKIYPDVYIFDGAGITNDGWSGGKKYYTVFEDMMARGFTKQRIEHSIIVFDEFDKMIEPATTSHGENMHESVQGEMLAMIEGTNVTINKKDSERRVTINTEHISFAFLGAFENLTKRKGESRKSVGFGGTIETDENPEITIEDIIKCGLRRELAGRIAKVVRLRRFTKEDYLNIIKMPIAGVEAKIAEEYGLESFTISPGIREKLADNAVKDGLGVRGMLVAAKELIDDELYETGKIPATV